MRFYSRETGSTYLAGFHKTMPADSVPLSEKRYQEVIANPVAGKVRSHDDEGLPILIDPIPDYAQIIASARYEREIAGVTVAGKSIATDRDNRATISDKALGAMIDPASACNLKTADGFVELTAPQILAISSAIRSYVQACFDREAVLLSAVEAGTYTEAMLATGWPSTIFESGVAQ